MDGSISTTDTLVIHWSFSRGFLFIGWWVDLDNEIIMKRNINE